VPIPVNNTQSGRNLPTPFSIEATYLAAVIDALDGIRDEVRSLRDVMSTPDSGVPEATPEPEPGSAQQVLLTEPLPSALRPAARPAKKTSGATRRYAR
jgi:hypothetical protein